MTIKEALKATINFPLPDNIIDKAIIDAALIGSADYSPTMIREVDLCTAGLLFILITSPDISEGDYSRKLPDRNVLLRLYSMYVTKWGQPDLLAAPKPTVKGRSNLW